jgi:hypothetical protein
LNNPTGVVTQILMVVCAVVACAGTVPVPAVKAVPVTADSYPFLSNARTLAPADLAKAGYVEEEFIVSGTANVYDSAPDGTLTVKTANAPYADRILVRRPSRAQRFSGTVVVEILSPTRRFDWGMVWGYLHDHILEHGDAWVGVTMPGAVQALKMFNPERYAALSFANPTPDTPCAGGGPAGNAGGANAKGGPNAKGGGGKAGPNPQEEGLRWDVLSQVAAALKSGAPNGPLGGFKGQFVYMTAGLQGPDVVTYLDAIHPLATLENGKPAYDGYLLHHAGPAGRISACAGAPPRDDPRAKIANVNVPVINVVAEGDVISSLPMRKPDSDDPGGRYRQYEIVSGAHIDQDAYYALPIFADQMAAVGAAQGTPASPLNGGCDPPMPLITHPVMRYALDGALANLDLWARKGMAPPKAGPIQVETAGTAPPHLVTNELGAAGGVRSVYIDVPVETHAIGGPGGGGACREMAIVTPFDAARIQALYGDQKKYAAKVNQSVDLLVKERFFTESDGKKMKAELLTTPVVTAARSTK